MLGQPQAARQLPGRPEGTCALPLALWHPAVGMRRAESWWRPAHRCAELNQTPFFWSSFVTSCDRTLQGGHLCTMHQGMWCITRNVHALGSVHQKPNVHARLSTCNDLSDDLVERMSGQPRPKCMDM